VNGAKIEMDDMVSGTPLHDWYTLFFLKTHYNNSAWNNNLECCEVLLAHGADVNQVDEDQRTPLHYAARRGYALVVKLLLSKGAQVHCQTRDGFTPLHLAAKYGRSDCVQILIEADADPNCQSHAHITPLHLASSRGSIECVEALVKANANLDVRLYYFFLTLL
jgi:cytohesin